MDEKFARLHNELFTGYDCNGCKNCCKMYYGSIPKADIEKDSVFLGITTDEFMKRYIKGEDSEENYQTNHKPCDFLKEDGKCKLGDCKPENCKKYPSTDQPERLQSLYSVLDTVSICPVAFEIYERLKKNMASKSKARKKSIIKRSNNKKIICLKQMIPLRFSTVI